MNNFYNPKYDTYYYNDDRIGTFIVPFLLGGLGGAAVGGLSRPRPVYVNPVPKYYNPMYYPNYNPYY